MKTLVNQLASGFVCIGLLLCSNGCTTRVDTVQSGSGSSASSYMLASEPAGALPVGEARNQIKDGDTVTLVGLIGGSSDPFVDGMAAFTIVDAKVPYCAPSEGCPTPWDYCCETAAVKENIATITIVDEAGKPVMSDAKKLLNVKELAKITVQGKAKRDPQGNLAVYATKLFVANGK